MINILNNPFAHHSDLQLTRQTNGAGAKSASGTQSSLPAAASGKFKIRDEYVPSSASSSGTYKRSSVSSAAFTMTEAAARQGKVTDTMRKEMKQGNGYGYWSAMGLLPVAYPAFNEIIDKVLDEKGLREIISIEGCSFNYSINTDGMFIFHPDEFNVSGVDPDFAKEICLALESAVNSSSFNIKDNPHLFTHNYLPADYDPAAWGRTIDREEWNRNRLPDFSGFIAELESDISEMFSRWQLTDISMNIDYQGQLTVTGAKTAGNTADAYVLGRINRGLTDDIKSKAEYLGLLMFAARNAVHGDVLMEGEMLEPFDDGFKGNVPQFRHEIILSGTDYTVNRTADQPRRSQQ